MYATAKLMLVREGIQDKKRGAHFRKKTEELSVGAGCRKNPGNWWKLGVSGQREIGKARLRRCEARKGD